jgi:hypothetical protein
VSSGPGVDSIAAAAGGGHIATAINCASIEARMVTANGFFMERLQRLSAPIQPGRQVSNGTNPHKAL